jgi:hypothetical protein
LAGDRIHILLAADEDARKHYDATDADLRRAHRARTRKYVGVLSVQKMTAVLKDARADKAKYPAAGLRAASTWSSTSRCGSTTAATPLRSSATR